MTHASLQDSYQAVNTHLISIFNLNLPCNLKTILFLTGVYGSGLMEKFQNKNQIIFF